MIARRPAFLGAASRWLLGLLLALCLGPASPVEASVDAKDYSAFWLWSGVRPQPVLDRAERIYLLESEIVSGHMAHIVAQRPALPHVAHADVWLVVRAATIAWTPDIYAHVLHALTSWRSAGNKVVGLQIDFDARTHGLANYAIFLKDLRNRLPPDYRLGVTGLLDWSANGDPAGLDALAGTIDEVVLQIYQGRHVIPGYESYIAKLDRMKMSFRIGLLQGGAWSEPEALTRHAFFRGYVVFLRNE